MSIEATLNNSEIEARFYALRQHWGVFQQDYKILKDWNFSLDKAKRRGGACFFHKKLITLSIHHIELNDEAVLIDTLIHEVAHALAWELDQENSHGAKWIKWVSILGGSSAVTGKFNTPKAKWCLVLACHSNGTIEKVAVRHKRSRKIKSWYLRGRPSTQGMLYYLAATQWQAWADNKMLFEELDLIQSF